MPWMDFPWVEAYGNIPIQFAKDYPQKRIKKVYVPRHGREVFKQVQMIHFASLWKRKPVGISCFFFMGCLCRKENVHASFGF